MSKFDVGVDFEKSAKVFLEHPDLGVLTDENGQKGWVEILSTKHPKMVTKNKKARERAKKMVRDMLRGKNDNGGIEQEDAEEAAYLCSGIVNWHLVNLAGKHIAAECNEENKISILTDPKWEFFKNVVNRGMANDEVFMPNSRLYSQATQSESSSLESSIPTQS